MGHRDTRTNSRANWLRILRWVVAIVAILVGVLTVLVVAAFGHCSAFGGTCPRPGGSSVDGDVFGGAAMGTALAVGVPLWMRTPTVRGLLQAVAVAAPVAAIVGALMMTAARG